MTTTQQQGDNARDNGGHPWRGHEGEFQELIWLRKQNAPPNSPRWNEPLSIVYPAIRRLAKRICESPGMASCRLDPRQVAQEWFVAFCRLGPERLLSDRPFFPYAYKMTVRICLTLARREQLRRTSELPVDLRSRETGPRGESLAREARRRVRRAIRQLGREDQLLLAERYWRNWRVRQMGEGRGISQAAINGRLHRARARLVMKLAQRRPRDATRRRTKKLDKSRRLPEG